MQIIDQPRFSIVQVARRLDVHAATIWRWTLRGVRGHRLPTVHVGGRRFVREADLEAFLAALNHRNPIPEDDRRQRADDAGKRLDAMGVSAPKTTGRVQAQGN